MRVSLLALMAGLLYAGAVAADGVRPVGTNCELAAPPDTAGEELSRGLTVRIYPRGCEIGAQSTGCQIMFAPKGSQWITVVIVEIIGGDPIRLWDPGDTMPEMSTCRYKNGKIVVGDPAKCPPPG